MRSQCSILWVGKFYILTFLKNQLILFWLLITFGSLSSHSEKLTLCGINTLKKSPFFFYYYSNTRVSQVEKRIMRIILCFHNLLLSEFMPVWPAIKNYGKNMTLIFPIPSFSNDINFTIREPNYPSPCHHLQNSWNDPASPLNASHFMRWSG